MSYYDEDPPGIGTISRWVVYSIIAGLVFISIMLALWFGGVIFQRETADFRGESAVIEDTRANSDFRQQAYDGFFNLCASIQSKEDAIEQQEKELETATGARQQQIQQNLGALNASRSRLINQYNADARKEWTLGQFQDSDLPYQIDEREQTTCES